MSEFTAVHHIGIPVPDLDGALAWYRDVLGLEDKGQTGGGGGPEISKALEVDGADVRFAFLHVGDVIVEMLEYKEPGAGKPFTSSNNDVGTVHLCFAVDDIDEAYEELSAKGVKFNAPPIRLDAKAGVLDGYAFAYFRDPHGVQLEMFELPDRG